MLRAQPVRVPLVVLKSFICTFRAVGTPPCWSDIAGYAFADVVEHRFGGRGYAPQTPYGSHNDCDDDRAVRVAGTIGGVPCPPVMITILRSIDRRDPSTH